MEQKKRSAFEDSGTQGELGIVGEFIAMLKQNKKFWLIPIFLILLGFGALIVLGSTAAAPFIYTLF